MKKSLKPNKKRLITLCLVLTGLTALWLYIRPDRAQAPESGLQEEESEAPFSLSGETADQRAAFLLQYRRSVFASWKSRNPLMRFTSLITKFSGNRGWICCPSRGKPWSSIPTA